MVIFLFLATFCIFFFLPVQFRLLFRRYAEDDLIVFEMSFLHGMVKRKWESHWMQVALRGLKHEETTAGRWFWWLKKKQKETIKSYFGNTGGLREFIDRNRHFGLGLTLLTYFLPEKYHRWLLVTDHLEKRGRFHRFVWKTRFGAGDSALTARLYGTIWGIKAMVLGMIFRQYRFAATPDIMVIGDFQNVSFEMVFDCIFRVKLGYIIIAAFMARLRYRILKGGVGIE